MGWLVGLPLGLLRLLWGFLLLALRLAIPLLLLVCVILLLRRARAHPPRQSKPAEPHFDGPVYTVEYRDEDTGEDAE